MGQLMMGGDRPKLGLSRENLEQAQAHHHHLEKRRTPPDDRPVLPNRPRRYSGEAKQAWHRRREAEQGLPLCCQGDT